MNWLSAKVEPLTGSRGLGLLSAYALLAVGAILLQAIPVLGIVLIIVGGPLWVGVLIHIALIHLTVRALSQKASRLWLAVPILFYVGGVAVHLASVNAANAEVAAINARNASLRLNVEKPFRYLRTGQHESLSLMQLYKADRSFLVQNKNAITTYTYETGSACETANQRWDYKRRDEPYAAINDLFKHYSGPNKTRQCILSSEGLPASWRYRIHGQYTSPKNRPSWLFKRSGHDYEIIDDVENRVLGKIEYARISTFPIIPFVTAGCISVGSSRWECTLGPQTFATTVMAGYPKLARAKFPYRPSTNPDDWEITPLAKALGLEPRRPTD